MNITANDKAAIDYFLLNGGEKAHKWVAFDFSNSKQMNYPHGFESAAEAVEFYSAANTHFDYNEQNFVDGNYHYMPLTSFIEALTSQYSPGDFQVLPEQLIAQLAVQDVQLFGSMDSESMMHLVRSGSIFPVQYDKEIDLKQEVDRFIVVAHHHAGHHVYEIGHSTKVMDTFTTLEKADAFLKDLTRQYHNNTDKNDYQLTGLYRGQDYHYDLEGTPENYSGATLKTAFFQYDADLKAKAWQVDTWQNMDEPKTLRHFLYAQYDEEKERFKLLDDRLTETRPNEIKISTYPSYFINKKLTIKQLEIMNEQSYEYVKDQLFYMGFGEEIAKTLQEKMAEGLNEFTLNHSRDFGKDKTESVLHFSKGDDQAKDLTFFNRFDMTLKQEGKEDLTQNFFVGQKYNYTLQERYNMMDGRFVYREQPKVEPKEVNGETKMVPTGETYLAWKGLNFKESDERGNFLPKTMFWKHEKEIVKYPLKEVEEPYDKNRLLAAMQKGNKASATIIRGNDEIKSTVVANPKMQRFDFYDENGQTLFVRLVEKQTQEKSETQIQGQQQQPESFEKQQQGQVQQQDQGKNETTHQVNQQNPDQAESKAQTAQHQDQPAQKEIAKTEVAAEQKNTEGQRKKAGVKI
jgi:hypothetical protein